MSSPTEQDPQKPTQDEPPAKEPTQDPPPAKQNAQRQRVERSTPDHLESEGSDEEAVAAEESAGYDEDASIRGNSDEGTGGR